jgi:hypothetical protein
MINAYQQPQDLKRILKEFINICCVSMATSIIGAMGPILGPKFYQTRALHTDTITLLYINLRLNSTSKDKI